MRTCPCCGAGINLVEHDREIRNKTIDEMLSYYVDNYEDGKRMENGKEPWSYWRSIIARLQKMKECEYDE